MIDFSKYRMSYITDDKELKRILDLGTFCNKEKIFFDTETYSKSQDINPLKSTLRLMQMLSNESDHVYVFDYMHLSKDLFHELLGQIYHSVLIGHNMIFDLTVMHRNTGVLFYNVEDTMAMIRNAYNPIFNKQGDPLHNKTFKMNLADACLYMLKEVVDKTDQKSNFGLPVLSEKQIKYAGKDPIYTKYLYNALSIEIDKQNVRPDYQIDCNNLPFTSLQNSMGIKIDVKGFKKLENKYKENIESLTNEINKIFDKKEDTLFGEENIHINLESPEQVLKALNEIGIECESTDKEALEAVIDKHPVVKPLIELGSLTTKLSSHISNRLEHVDENDRVQAQIHSLFLPSGRKSCSKPFNLMNIPREKEFRELYIAEDGYCFVVADYNALEFRIVASITNCFNAIHLFNMSDKLGPNANEYERKMYDIHYVVASKILRKSIDSVTKAERQIYKSYTYGLIYGASGKTLQKYILKNTGVLIDYKQCLEDIKVWYEYFPEIKNWHNKIKSIFEKPASWRATNELRTITNKIMRLNPNKDWVVNEALNYQVQPVAATGVKLAENRIGGHLLLQDWGTVNDNNTRIIIQVHDELLVQVPIKYAEESSKFIKAIMEDSMENVTRRKLPMTVECHFKNDDGTYLTKWVK